MAGKTGVVRLHQAIMNQQDFGNSEFRLTYHDAEEIAAEIEEELSRLSWAEGVPAPVDADGEVVPLGTEKLYTDDGEMVRVESICHGARLWYVRRMHSDKTYRLDALHLKWRPAMISDEKRREVAAKLRAEAESWRHYREGDNAFCMNDSEFTEAVLEDFGFDDMDMPTYEVFDQMADIVEVRSGDCR